MILVGALSVVYMRAQRRGRAKHENSTNNRKRKPCYLSTRRIDRVASMHLGAVIGSGSSKPAPPSDGDFERP